MAGFEDPFDETLEVGTIVGKKYKVIQKLGEGGCGSVFKVEDTEDKNALYALKVEFASANAGNVLKMEVQILSQLVNKKHVAKCVASGKKERYSYMVMTLLGESLESLVKKHGPFFNVSTQIRVGICLLFGIKQIHDIGYIHRDLKPANMALGYKGSPDERIFLVLDFGLARQYITDEENGKKMMRRPREKALFRGTARYCSVAMHDRSEQGRVDDMWALVYIMAELRCRLPWHDVDDKVEIGEMKRLVSDEKLFGKSPIQMLEVVKIVKSTQFYDRPDYEKIYKLLEEVMKSADYKWADPYHWEGPKNKINWQKAKSLSLSPSFRSVRKKKAKTVTPPKPEAKPDVIECPYFTVEDFQGNPIGF